MTPEQQRIAIAEACGWRKLYEAFHSQTGSLIQWWRNGDDMDSDTTSLPDYLNDLNAMHEAEKALEPVFQTVEYGVALVHAIEKTEKITTADGSAHWGKLAHATAAQRAEAFLRTVGKWVEKTS